MGVWDYYPWTTLIYLASVLWLAQLWVVGSCVSCCLVQVILLASFAVEDSCNPAWLLNLQRGWKALPRCEMLHSFWSTAWSWTWVLLWDSCKWFHKGYCYPAGAVRLLSNLLRIDWHRLSLVHMAIVRSQSYTRLQLRVSGPYHYTSFELLRWRINVCKQGSDSVQCYWSHSTGSAITVWPCARSGWLFNMVRRFAVC